MFGRVGLLIDTRAFFVVFYIHTLGCCVFCFGLGGVLFKGIFSGLVLVG